uniref:Osiris 16 n=1 Tax=Bactrocera latifrons TaxID=174628 RepID=A0A0K8U792_BACLA
MLPQRTMEYLFYLGFFILLLRFADADAATVRAFEEPASENSLKAPPASHSSPTETAGTSSSNSKRDVMKRAFEECKTQLSWMCLKIEFVKIMERLMERDELKLVPGVSVVRNANATEGKSNDLMAEVARSYPNDPNSRLNGYIVNKLSSFLQTHFLRFKLIDSETMAEAHSAVETGRKGKFGKKGGMEALIAAGLMMKGTLMAIGMAAVALMAGKALMTALMALTLSSVLGLKSLASGGGKSTTYEIVSKPVYTSSHSHSYDEGHSSGHGHMGGGHSGSGYGGYARSLNLESPNELQ